MKKALVIIIVFSTICCSLAACGGEKASPSSTVKTLFEAIKAFDTKKMQSCLLAPGESSDFSKLESNAMTKALLTSWKEWASKLEYTIEDTNVEGDNASVTANCKYTDASAVMTSAMSAYMLKGIGAALSGGSIDAGSIFKECYEEAVKKIGLGSTEAKVSIDLVKRDNEWKIKSLPDDIFNIFTANSIKSLSNLSDAFSFEPSSQTTEAPTAEAPTTEAPTTPTTTEAVLSEVGYWIMTHYKSGNHDLDNKTIRQYEEASGFKAFIVFESNGFGYLNVFGSEQDFTWENGDAGGLAYTFDNETLIMKDATTEFAFSRSFDPAPARGSLVDKP